jgi:protein-tyrosine phosphatase
MDKFKFGPARQGERIVYGSQRPGYSNTSVAKPIVDEWISFMKSRGILRVCCLLGPAQLAYYKPDLLDQYRLAFGEHNVSSAPVEDYHLCASETLETRILPFLNQADRAGEPVLVHCSGGIGRTGHVLAAWLVRGRGLDVGSAIQAVVALGRNPCESVECGNATKAQLHRLLEGDIRRAV